MAYTLADAIVDTRRHLKDTTQNVWKDADVKAFINDAIRIVKRSIPSYFISLAPVSAITDEINIDNDYAFILALFASARCFEQDEQNYRAVQKMNEFETRRTEMINEVFERTDYVGNDFDAVQDVYYNSDNDEDYVLPLVP